MCTNIVKLATFPLLLGALGLQIASLDTRKWVTATTGSLSAGQVQWKKQFGLWGSCSECVGSPCAMWGLESQDLCEGPRTIDAWLETARATIIVSILLTFASGGLLMYTLLHKNAILVVIAASGIVLQAFLQGLGVGAATRSDWMKSLKQEPGASYGASLAFGVTSTVLYFLAAVVCFLSHFREYKKSDMGELTEVEAPVELSSMKANMAIPEATQYISNGVPPS